MKNLVAEFMKKRKQGDWTENEDKLLAKTFKDYGISKVYTIFNNVKSREDIKKRLVQLNLVKSMDELDEFKLNAQALVKKGFIDEDGAIAKTMMGSKKKDLTEETRNVTHWSDFEILILKIFARRDHNLKMSFGVLGAGGKSKENIVEKAIELGIMSAE